MSIIIESCKFRISISGAMYYRPLADCHVPLTAMKHCLHFFVVWTLGCDLTLT